MAFAAIHVQPQHADWKACDGVNVSVRAAVVDDDGLGADGAEPIDDPLEQGTRIVGRDDNDEAFGRRVCGRW